MDRAEAKARVLNVLSAVLGQGPDTLDETETLNSLGADSLASLEIHMELEDEFRLDISDTAFSNLKTVGAIVDYITRTTTMHEDRVARHNTQVLSGV